MFVTNGSRLQGCHDVLRYSIGKKVLKHISFLNKVIIPIRELIHIYNKSTVILFLHFLYESYWTVETNILYARPLALFSRTSVLQESRTEGIYPLNLRTKVC